MTLSLLVLGVAFLFLMWDSRRLTSQKPDMPYELEAKSRGESLDGVPIEEQRRRESWHRHHGIGRSGQIVWLWLTLAVGCFAGAIFSALR